MTRSKEAFLEQLLRSKYAFKIPSRKMAGHARLAETLNSDLEIFIGGQVVDAIVQRPYEEADAKGHLDKGCLFSLPSGRDRWIKLFAIYAQQGATRSSTLLAKVLVVATLCTTLAAGIQAYCSYKTYRNQPAGQGQK